jgi:O-antigen/teichoic acid export membrane protein
LRLNWGLAIGLGCLTLGLSPWLISLFGERFHGVGPVLSLAICFIVIDVACSVAGQIFQSSGRMWPDLGINIIWDILMLSMVIILIPLYGGIGLPIAYLFANSLILILQLVIITNLFGKTAIVGIAMMPIFSGLLIFYALMTRIISSSYFYNMIILSSIIVTYLIISKNDFGLKNILYPYVSLLKGRIGGYSAKPRQNNP